VPSSVGTCGKGAYGTHQLQRGAGYNHRASSSSPSRRANWRTVRLGLRVGGEPSHPIAQLRFGRPGPRPLPIAHPRERQGQAGVGARPSVAVPITRNCFGTSRTLPIEAPAPNDRSLHCACRRSGAFASWQDTVSQQAERRTFGCDPFTKLPFPPGRKGICRRLCRAPVVRG
jgi:hypothetical protein